MTKKLTIRLYPGEDDDLIEWQEAQGGHHGAKAHAIKEALRRGIAESVPSQAPAAVEIDLGAIRAVVESAVESGIATALAGLDISAATAADEDEEIDRMLDGLGESLVLQ